MLKPETKENLKQTFKESFLILMYEMIGTAMMTVLILNFYAQISFPDCSQDVHMAGQIIQGKVNATGIAMAGTTGDPGSGAQLEDACLEWTDSVCTKKLNGTQDYLGCKVIDNVGLLLGMFVTIMFSARISGSHFNPCITFSYMIGNVKQGKFDRILGLLYMAAQCAGAQLGGFFAHTAQAGRDIDIKLSVPSDDIFQQMIVEVFGSFFLVFMYLSSTEEKTKFTKDAAIQTIILAGSYLGAMMLAGTKLTVLQASPVNPAIVLAVMFWQGNTDIWSSCYIFLLFPFIGSALALIFFRFIYQKTTEAMEEMDAEEEENDNHEALLDN